MITFILKNHFSVYIYAQPLHLLFKVIKEMDSDYFIYTNNYYIIAKIQLLL